MGKYDDIINLPHYELKNHIRMSVSNRAAQFRPFAALTGYDDAVKETARLTSKRIELDADAIEILDRELMKIKENISTQPTVNITYFQPDKAKSGGEYIKVTAQITKIDEYGKIVHSPTGLKIPIGQIISIEETTTKEAETV